MAKRHHIVSVLVDGVSALEPAVADDFFGDDRSALGVPWYRYTVCSPTPAPAFVRVGSVRTQIDHGLEALRRADTIVIPGWSGRDRPPPEDLVRALRAAHRRGARIVSFCTGAFVLAAAGLLDGKRATTHWATGEEFRARFPEVELDASVLYIDEGQVLTSAGVAASIDLALHLIRRDFGASIANAVARDMVVPAHREGGQAQFVDTPIECCLVDGDDLFSQTLDWAVAHLAEPLTVEQLAGRAMTSPRQFARRFKERTGTTPHRWVLAQRTALAQRLLESTDLPIERVAQDCGFGTAGALRLHFSRALRTSPQRYRAMFRCDDPADPGCVTAPTRRTLDTFARR